MREQSKSKSKFKKSSGLDIELLESQLARALADYDNLRKRIEGQQEVWIKFASQTLLAKLLPVLDTLEAAQSHLKDQGLAIALNEFKKVLDEEGLEELRPDKGDRFDPKVHEAVETVEGEPFGSFAGTQDKSAQGKVAELVLTGWKFKDGMIVRAAKVRVYGEKSKKAEELEKEVARGDYV